MMTSENTVLTALLETILAQHKEKENKNYMPLKLKAADLKKFGFAKATPAPSANALKEALWPHLGENLMLKDKDGVLCLAQKMTQEEWERMIVEEKNAVIKKVLDQQRKILDQNKAKEKISSMLLKLKAPELKILGLKATPAPSATVLENALRPCLGSELMLVKKKPDTAKGKEVLYLAYKMPLEELVKESLLVQSAKKSLKMPLLKTAAAYVPMKADEFIRTFNEMLITGQLQVTKIDEKFTITGVKLASGTATAPTTPRPAPQPTHQHVSGQDDTQLFSAAFEKLDRGRIYVRICNMRRELRWNEERFNALLRKLRADGTIQLHAGDVSSMTEEDVNLSYIDENNLFYATLTWKKS